MSAYFCEVCSSKGVWTEATGCSGEAGDMWMCDEHGGWGTHDERTLQDDATWNSALEAAAKVLLDSGLQGNTASKHEVAQRILSLKRGQS